jgi:hypothetical protein
VLGTDGKCYAVPLEGAQLALTLRGENGLRTRLARAYFDDTQSAAGASAIADAMTVLEGQAVDTDPNPSPFGSHARRVARARPRHLRRARRSRSSPGWEIVDASPVLFRRTRLTSPLPTPSGRAAGEVDGFDRLKGC